jgi:ubiquinone/menaquinone biosynthesis C-methylase UbiE
MKLEASFGTGPQGANSLRREKNISVFNADIKKHTGYVYTRPGKLSSVLANRKITDAICEMTSFRGKRVIDIGCGDGTYSKELLLAGASEVLGIDAAESAIEKANSRVSGMADIHFEVGNIYQLKVTERYDIAVLRGILHHLNHVKQAISNIVKIADEIIVLEPNGYNPVLKVIEKTSPYHIQHEEKSYYPAKLDHWFESCGCTVVNSSFIGFVPMFCPDFAAKMLKIIEPVIEKLPFVRQLLCGQYLAKIFTHI